MTDAKIVSGKHHPGGSNDGMMLVLRAGLERVFEGRRLRLRI